MTGSWYVSGMTAKPKSRMTVNPTRDVVIHHLRDEAGEIHTRIVGSGDIELSPPGLTVPVVDILRPAGKPEVCGMPA